MSTFELNDLVVCVSDEPADKTNLRLDKFYIVKRTNIFSRHQIAIDDLSGNEVKWVEGDIHGYSSSRFRKIDIPQVDRQVLINANKGSC